MAFAFCILMMIFLIMPNGLKSQEVEGNEEITVTTPYQPSVASAKKINVSPRIPDEKLVKPKFDYRILPKEYQLAAELEPIVPARIEGESVSKLYRNYIRAGIGNYITPYLEFYATKLRSKKNAFGVHFKHRSSAGKIKDYGYPGNSNTSVSLFGKKFLPAHTFTGEVFYKRKGLHYYGYREDDFPGLELSKKDIKQRFGRVGFKTLFESNDSRSGIPVYGIGFNYSYLVDRYDASEHYLELNGNLQNDMEFFDFSEEEKLGIKVNLDYFFNADTVIKHNSGIISFAPFYKLKFDQYAFQAGINASIEADTLSSMHFYPMLRAEVNVVEDYLVTYAGITGSLEKNSLLSLSETNPFIISTIEKRFTNNKIDQFGGLRGKLSKFLDFNLSFMNSTISDMPFFVNDTVSALGEGLNNQFTIAYDRVKLTRLVAEFGLHFNPAFNMSIRGRYNSYFLDDEKEAWHKPKLEISIMADYNIREKIYLRAEMFSFSNMYAKTYEPGADPDEVIVVAKSIDPRVDVNLGLEYRYSKVLSGFVNLNNILGQRYYEWYNYPSYRFNMLMGITYSF